MVPLIQGPRTERGENMLEDLRFVGRTWRQKTGFFATASLTVALAVALAAGVFAFADGYLFRPLPFPSAGQLYLVSEPNAPIASALTAADTAALRHSGVAGFGFVEWAVSARIRGDLLIDGRRVSISANSVSPGFRRAIELPLLAGRDFTDDDHPGLPVSAWLGHRFWQREFGGDVNVLGRTFAVEHPSGERLDLQVVGILGPGVTSFDLNNAPPDLVVPAVMPEPVSPNLLSFPIVRLPDGMTRAQGEALIADALQAVAPAADGRPRMVRLRLLRDAQQAGGRPTALAFFTAAMLIVLLAAVNLVHLLLVRGVSRAGEIRTRLALGASRWRIARLFVLEALSVGVIGTVIGLGLGSWFAAVIRARIPVLPTDGRNLALVPMFFDWRVLGFAIGLGFLIALIAACGPVSHAWRESFHARGWGSPGAFVPARTSRAILACEVAAATVVVVGTVFLGAGIWRYLHQPLGFEYTDRFAVSIRPIEPRPVAPGELEAAGRAMGQLAGVRAAGPYQARRIPEIDVPGRALDPAAVEAYGVGDGYFTAWSLQTRIGRWFTPAEMASGASVAVVDALFASTMWPDDEVIGQQVRVGGGAPREVVGVIEAPRWSLRREPRPSVYVPDTGPPPAGRFVVWVPRGTLPDVESAIAAAVRGAAPSVEASIAAVTFDGLFLREAGEARFQAPFMVVFGVLALGLAGIGIFGVMSYVVERRTREFGIRLALGARARDVWRMVTAQSIAPAAVGLLSGVAGAYAIHAVVRTTVFGWESSGAWAVAIAGLALFSVAVLAAVPPALRAVRVDPTAVLRME